MINPNDPAFPASTDHEFSGLTKREYFAAMAMQALIYAGNDSDFAALYAVEAAAELIEALNQQGDG